MGSGGMLQIKSRTLPLLVAAITVPIIAATILGGPMAGLGAGALVATAIIVLAVRQKPDEPIEVARAADERRRVLVVLCEAIEEPLAAQAVAMAATEPGSDSPADDVEVLVVAPARNTPLAHWLSDLRRARLDAQRRLVLTLGSLAAGGLDARGEVGDSDSLQATEDVLRRFSADVVLVAAPGGEVGDELIRELRRRLEIPVARIGAGGAPERSPAGRTAR